MKEINFKDLKTKSLKYLYESTPFILKDIPLKEDLEEYSKYLNKEITSSKIDKKDLVCQVTDYSSYYEVSIPNKVFILPCTVDTKDSDDYVELLLENNTLEYSLYINDIKTILKKKKEILDYISNSTHLIISNFTNSYKEKINAIFGMLLDEYSLIVNIIEYDINK